MLSASEESLPSTYSNGIRPRPLVFTELLCQNATSKAFTVKIWYVQRKPGHSPVRGPAVWASPQSILEM